MEKWNSFGSLDYGADKCTPIFLSQTLLDYFRIIKLKFYLYHPPLLPLYTMVKNN